MIYNFISLVFRLHVLIDKQSDKYNCMAYSLFSMCDYEGVYGLLNEDF